MPNDSGFSMARWQDFRITAARKAKGELVSEMDYNAEMRILDFRKSLISIVEYAETVEPTCPEKLVSEIILNSMIKLLPEKYSDHLSESYSGEKK